MSRDVIQSRPTKSLGFGKAFIALSRTSSFTIDSIKQKFKLGVMTSHPSNKEKDKKQRTPTLKRLQAKINASKKKANRKKSEKRKKKDEKESIKNRRTFDVPKRRSKARLEKRRRSNKVDKVVKLSKNSYINVKNFLKPICVPFFYTGLFQHFGNPEYPFDNNRRTPLTKKQRERKYKLTRFKFFNNLPKEIRSMIWRASFESRIVTVEIHAEINTKIRKIRLVGAHMTIPLALSVCRESRAEALLWYADLNPEGVRPIYFHSTLDSFATRVMEVARNPDPKKRWTQTNYCVKDILYFLGHMGSVFKEIPKFVRCITIPRACWSNDRYWDTKMQLAWNEGWGYEGLKEIVVLEYIDNKGQHLQHEKFLESYFEIIKKTHPDCVVPRIRIILDRRGHLPYSSEGFLPIMGEGMYEDIDAEKDDLRRCDACWIKWFESDF
ncbi:hypothetical protein EAE96_005212 [Botrytis aclada]|nr:hypothetical protein EAE96_005212 [Botrytis aclada]